MESLITIRLNGFLSFDSTTNKTYPVIFEGRRLKLSALISKMALPIPEEAVSFYSINGVKANNDSVITNGDVIDVFPVVAGG